MTTMATTLGPARRARPTDDHEHDRGASRYDNYARYGEHNQVRDDASRRDHGDLAPFLALGQRLLSAVEQHATQLALYSSGLPDLPPVVGSAEDQSHLRTVPPLYLASELEAAGLLTAVETLAGLFVTGGLSSDPGPAAPLLVAFWRGRHQRFAAPERRAFYARLFGGDSGPALAMDGGRNNDFEGLMISFAEALYKLHPDPSFDNLGFSSMGAATEVTLQMAASALAENLASRGGGMALYAGRDLLSSIHSAVSILKTPAVQRALGVHGIWTAVDAINTAYLHQSADIDSHITRGQSGMALLTWLSEMTQSLTDDRKFLLSADDPSIAAATAWLEASLTLREHEAAQAPLPGPSSAVQSTQSAWRG